MSIVCSECQEEFSSRNKLFSHVRNIHHEAELTSSASSSSSTAAVEGNQGGNGSSSPVLNQEDVTVAYSDPWLLVVSKPQGMSTQRQRGEAGRHNTLPSSPALLLDPAARRLYPHPPPPQAPHSVLLKARAAHRIDKHTGGLVLCGKSREADCALKALFRERQISKRYVAVVSGRMNPPCGEISYPLDDKPCLSRYRALHFSRSASYGCCEEEQRTGSGGWITTVELFPITGRTHQLRRHLKIFGHPIIGDMRYTTLPLPLSLAACPYAAGGLNQLYLWAVEMQFRHPFMLEEEEEKKKEEEKVTLQRKEKDDDESYNQDQQNGLASSIENISCDNFINSITDSESDKSVCKLSMSVINGGPRYTVVHVEIPEPPIFQQLRDLENGRWEQQQQLLKEEGERDGGDSSRDLQEVRKAFSSSCDISSTGKPRDSDFVSALDDDNSEIDAIIPNNS